MDVQQVAYLFAVAIGIVSSGIIGSLWAVFTDEAPSFDMLTFDDSLAPLKVPVLIMSGPTTTIISSFWWMIERPLLGVPLLLAGLAWSFFQGVFILTQIFGVT